MILKSHLAHDWRKIDPVQTLVTEKELLKTPDLRLIGSVTKCVLQAEKP